MMRTQIVPMILTPRSSNKTDILTAEAAPHP